MKSEWEKVDIGDRTFAFEIMKPEHAFALSLRFAEAFGGVIASFVPVLNMDSEKIDIFNIDWTSLNLSEIQGGITSACAQMDARKIKPIFDAVLPICFVTDKNDPSDKGHRCGYDDFSGNIKDLYQVVFYALRFNFADFFAGSPQTGSDGLGALNV